MEALLSSQDFRNVLTVNKVWRHRKLFCNITGTTLNLIIILPLGSNQKDEECVCVILKFILADRNVRSVARGVILQIG